MYRTAHASRIAEKLVVLLLVSTWFVGIVRAQPSMAGADIQQFSVTIDGANASVTVYRDGRDTSQFYYLPLRARLTTRTVNGENIPNFSLIQFNLAGVADPTERLVGGLLQLSVSLVLDKPALDSLMDQIKEQFQVQNPRLTILPITRAHTYLLLAPSAPGQAATDGTLVKIITSSSPGDAGLAPTSLSQEVAFSAFLSPEGADIFRTAATKAAGFNAFIGFSYYALTPKVGIRVTADWDRLFDYYDNNRIFAAKASFLGIFGGSANITSHDIRTEMEGNQLIKVDVTTGPDLTQDMVDRYLTPVLKQINDQIVEDSKVPASIPQANAVAPNNSNSSGLFNFTAGYSQATVTLKQRKSGKAVFEYNAQKLVEVPSLASGSITLFGQPQLIIDDLISTVQSGPWDTIVVPLPSMRSASVLSIDQMTINLIVRNRNTGKQFALGAGWTDNDNTWHSNLGPALTKNPNLIVPLSSRGISQSNRTSFEATLTSQVDVLINGNGQTVPATTTADIGQATILFNPLAFIHRMEVSTVGVTFHALDATSSLNSVDVNVFSPGNDVFTRSLAPLNVDGRTVPPTPVVIMIPKEKVATTKAQLTFHLHGRPTVNFPENPVPILQLGGTSIVLAWIPTGKKTANGITGLPACFSL